MRSFFLVIEGAIGVGKTTLARLLQPRFASGLLLEAFEENPFLADFYADTARYAFQTQMFFLLSRYQQQQAVPALLRRGPLVADYAFVKDSLFARLNLEGDEWDVYKRLYDVLADRNPLPDLVIYLRADTDVLMARIARRDRTYERRMDRAYIEHLRQSYEKYFSAYTQTALLAIDTNELDYVEDAAALAWVESQVRTALGIGAYQQALPQMEPGAQGRAGLMMAPSTLAEAAQGVSGWGVVVEFLAASEAMGRVGAALAGGWAGRPELGMALWDLMARVQRLARSAEVDLPEAKREGTT
jgi:deoxyadenosine/deoxycytidine kinase